MNPALLTGERAYLEQVDHKEVARLGTLHRERAAEHVDTLEPDVPDIVGRVVVADLTVGPIEALDANHVSGRDLRDRRDIRVPAVVPRERLCVHRLGQVHLEDRVGIAGYAPLATRRSRKIAPRKSTIRRVPSRAVVPAGS